MRQQLCLSVSDELLKTLKEVAYKNRLTTSGLAATILTEGLLKFKDASQDDLKALQTTLAPKDKPGPKVVDSLTVNELAVRKYLHLIYPKELTPMRIGYECGFGETATKRALIKLEARGLVERNKDEDAIGSPEQWRCVFTEPERIVWIDSYPTRKALEVR